jgi:hypothetical protein
MTYKEADMSELYHYGIKGQKWGIRRYQNEDGTLTPEGKKRYLNPDGSYNDLAVKELKIQAGNYSKQQRTRDKKLYGKGAEKRINERMAKGESVQSARHDEVIRKERNTKIKNSVTSTAKQVWKPIKSAIIGVGTAVAIAALTPIVVNKVNNIISKSKSKRASDLEEDLTDYGKQMFRDGGIFVDDTGWDDYRK